MNTSSSSKMKRQRGVIAVNGVINNPPRIEEVPTMAKKKAKKEEEQKNTTVAVVKEEEKKKENRDIDGSGLSQEKEGGVFMNWEEYMPWLGLGGVAVDEQMSWSSTWFPAWDMDFMGEREAINALCSDDVVWAYDIWNLKNQIPIPVDDNINKRVDLE